MCEDTCDTAALVISELVTNAIVHTASSHVVCELHDHDDLVRIAVRDEGCAPGEPHPSPRRPEEEHGRGLLLIDALCRAWGAQESGAGLLVWAELPRGADAATDPAPAYEAGTLHSSGTGQEAGVRHQARPGQETGAGHEAGTGRESSTADHVDGARGDLGWGPRPKPAPTGGEGGSGGADGPEGADGSGGRDTARGSLHTGEAPRPAAAGDGRVADGVRAAGVAALPVVESEAVARRHGVGETFRHGVAQLRQYGLGIGRPRSAGTEWG